VSVRSTITLQFEQVASEHSRTLETLTDELKLFDSGLDSLSLATIVLRLAELFRSDPFSSDFAEGFPATFGDLVRMYETSAGNGTGDQASGGLNDTE
jgi:acyl carrier protein